MLNTNFLIYTHKLPAWMERKAQASRGLSRIGNTVKEQHSLQRSDPPRVEAVQPAALAGRPQRLEGCDGTY